MKKWKRDISCTGIICVDMAATRKYAILCNISFKKIYGIPLVFKRQCMYIISGGWAFSFLLKLFFSSLSLFPPPLLKLALINLNLNLNS